MITQYDFETLAKLILAVAREMQQPAPQVIIIEQPREVEAPQPPALSAPLDDDRPRPYYVPRPRLVAETEEKLSALKKRAPQISDQPSAWKPGEYKAWRKNIDAFKQDVTQCTPSRDSMLTGRW